MDSPTSNLAWGKLYSFYIPSYQVRRIPMLYASVNTAQSRKTGTGWSVPKNGDLSKKTQRPWHHSIDSDPTFPYAKFEVGLPTSLTRKSVFKKKG
ncbi:hypothetical protein [Absidia glauca]|uniref:Ndc10 domain-containing protein n=1 Tax=Absidia glauca TaxID=4829 RepID=A0A168MNS5_ABSGL|nr:hypothetical protein [Absidia glauca]